MKRTSLIGALTVAAMGVASPLAMVEPLHPEPRPTSRAVRDPHDRKRDRSRYMPHQGKREIARRLRQAKRT